MFILQVIEETEASCGEVFADHGHPEIASVLAAILGGEGEASLVCSAAGFSKLVFPFFARSAAGVPVGSGMLAAVVEEAFVVILGLEG